MIVQKIVCDKCLKVIEEDPFSLVPEIVEKDNPEIMKESTYENQFYRDQSKRHYCERRIEKILYFANHRAAEVNQDFDKAVIDMIYASANEAEQQGIVAPEEDPQEAEQSQSVHDGSEQPAKKTVLRKEERWIRKSL